MLNDVYLKTLRDQRRGLAIWGGGVALLVVGMSAIFPQFRDMPDLGAFLSNYPEAMRKLFDLDAMVSGAGFLNAELFTLMLPLLFAIFAIGLGARLVAGEEQSGTLEVLLSTPASRSRVLIEKAAALTTAVMALGVVLLAVTLISSPLFDLGVGLEDAATGSAAMALYGLEHGLIALLVGAVTGRRGVAIAWGSSVAVAGYALYVAAAFVESIDSWKLASPFYQATGQGPLGGGWPAAYWWLLLVGVAAVVVAVPLFNRRDVAV